jgi:hypothetical protein
MPQGSSATSRRRWIPAVGEKGRFVLTGSQNSRSWSGWPTAWRAARRSYACSDSRPTSGPPGKVRPARPIGSTFSGAADLRSFGPGARRLPVATAGARASTLSEKDPFALKMGDPPGAHRMTPGTRWRRTQAPRRCGSVETEPPRQAPRRGRISLGWGARAVALDGEEVQRPVPGQAGLLQPVSEAALLAAARLLAQEREQHRRGRIPGPFGPPSQKPGSRRQVFVRVRTC